MNGLKKMRANQNSKTPEHACANCKCKRYSPCTCMKSYEEVVETSQPDAIQVAIDAVDAQPPVNSEQI